MSRSAAELRPPGIFLASGEQVQKSLVVADTRIAGFVGLAAKGPLDEPRRIGSWDEFLEVYGTSETGFMSRAVEGFFLNGGQTCYIVRVAKRARGEGAVAGPEHAFSAERSIRDAWDKPCLRLRARSEGRWGNNIWARFAQTTGAKGLLTQDLEVGSGEASVNATRGFEKGALVRIYDREASDYVVLTEVADRKIRWASATPVNRRYRAAGPTYVEVLEFELHVALRDRRETFKGLQLHPSSRRYCARVVQEESTLVAIDDLNTRSPLPHNLPREDAAATKLIGGRDGSDTVGPEEFVGFDNGPADRAGLLALCSVEDVSMLCVPDAMLLAQRKPGPEGEMAAQRIQDQMIIQCELRQDRFALLDLPPTSNLQAVQRWRRRSDTSYAAYYWPWLGTLNGDGKIVRVPPSGHMAGMFAQCDTAEGVHRVPANLPVKGVVDISVAVTEDDQGMLNAEGINCFRLARGIRPWGARTASSDPDWRYVNVRRLFIMMRRSLEAGMAWAVFEPNHPNTWKTLQDSVSDFLAGLLQQGMFAGGSREEAFFVRCNEETNPPEVRDSGMMVCEVGVAPVVPAEFIMIKVTQRLGDDGGDAGKE
jgi:uncharacterized protein